MKKIKHVYALIIALIVLAVDQITKYFFSHLMKEGASFAVIRNVFHFSLVMNKGAGFGMFQGGRIFFIIFSFVVLGALLYEWNKIPQDINLTFPLGLILGGLLGNLIDRIFLGHVIDFLDFRVWPVFNIADSAITIGAIWLVIYLWKK